jgi:hypothetical protein
MIIARFLNEAESMILVDFGSGKKVSVPVDGGNERLSAASIGRDCARPLR